MKKYERSTLTIGEAAEVLGVHIDTVRNWEKRGYVTAVKTPGGHRRFNTDEIVSIAGRTLMSTKIYEKEEEHLIKRWEKTGILKELPEVRKGPIAVLMENQRLFNEQSTDSGDLAQFKRISIPLVRRWFGWTKAFDLVSVQPMLGPTGIIHHFKKNQIVEDTIVAQTKRMKACWAYEAQQDLRAQHNLDAEAELTAVLAMELTMETDRQILTDLRTNAAVKRTLNFEYLHENVANKYKIIQQEIVKTGKELCELYGRPMPNWIVASDEIVKDVIQPHEGFTHEGRSSSWDFLGSLSVQSSGTWKVDDDTELKVFSDPLFPKGGILLGYKGEHVYDAGYVYSPYCPIQTTPVVLDPDSFTPRRGIMQRFGFKLVNPTYYASLHFEGFKSLKDMEDEKNGKK